MDNIKDTPMDYKQFEGHYIPNKEVPPEETAQALRNKFREKNKECESLKLELQKQKELNAELIVAARSMVASEMHPYTIEMIESLIKKSSEI